VASFGGHRAERAAALDAVEADAGRPCACSQASKARQSETATAKSRSSETFDSCTFLPATELTPEALSQLETTYPKIGFILVSRPGFIYMSSRAPY
jgi:hypothetical protein